MTLTVPYSSSIEGTTQNETCRWKVFTEGRTFECRVIIVSEETGFSAHAADLPGVVSQGDTVEDALSNITQACRGAISEYLTTRVIPWSEVSIEGEIVCEKRILVDA